MSEWELARTRKLRAVRFNGAITLGAEGVKPTPCYEVEFHKSPIEVYPPEYNLVWRQPPGTVCIQVLTPYQVTQRIDGGGFTDVVVVHHAGGTERVPIFDLDLGEAGEREAAAAEGGDLYTGTSHTSFQEAYYDALARIPHAPDEPVRTVVVEQRGLHGGFLGFNELSVTLRHVGAPAGGDGGPGAEEACDHVTRYHAEQNRHDVIIHAEGENPGTGWTQRLVQRPERIWPPNFEVLHRAPTGPSLPVLTPFFIYTSFPAATRIDEVTVFDAHGPHRVEVEQVPDAT
jgi:flavin-binding protein dodecin